MAGVVGQLQVGNAKLCSGKISGVSGEFAVEPHRTNNRSVLIPRSMRYECFVCDGHSVIAGLSGCVANNKTVFTHESADREPDILDDKLIGHCPPIFQGCYPLEKRGGPGQARPFLKLKANYVFCLQALRPLTDLKLHSLPFIQAPVTLRLNGRVMHENVLTGLALYEAKTFACIEPLHSTLFFHLFSLFLGYLALLAQPHPQKQRGGELYQLAAPFNGSKGFYKSNKRNPLSHTFGCGTLRFLGQFRKMEYQNKRSG